MHVLFRIDEIIMTIQDALDCVIHAVVSYWQFKNCTLVTDNPSNYHYKCL